MHQEFDHMCLLQPACCVLVLIFISVCVGVLCPCVCSIYMYSIHSHPLVSMLERWCVSLSGMPLCVHVLCLH